VGLLPISLGAPDSSGIQNSGVSVFNVAEEADGRGSYDEPKTRPSNPHPPAPSPFGKGEGEFWLAVEPEEKQCCEF